MFIALVSVFTNRTARSDTAMTGEISLRGLVLPVGGIKEKVIAAQRAGLTRVMLPARNRRDYDDIPEDTRKKLAFVWLERVEDAVAEALEAEFSGCSVKSLISIVARNTPAVGAVCANQSANLSIPVPWEILREFLPPMSALKRDRRAI